MNTYVFDQGWQKERDRLAGIESSFDSYSTQRLADLGVSDGWHCLEVGFGAGGVALWLAGQVGSTGRVVATDLDPRFLAGHGRANLDVRQHDIVTDPLEGAAFDLAHARAVLEHIPDRQRALQRMISAVRPGGWLVLEDIDFGGSWPRRWRITLTRPSMPPRTSGLSARSRLPSPPPEAMPSSARGSSGRSPTPGW